MLYLALFLFLCIHWMAPLPVQVVLFVVNVFVPDMVPVIDELIMLLAVVNRIKTYITIRSFMEEHKILTILLLGIMIVGAVMVFRWLFGFIMG